MARISTLGLCVAGVFLLAVTKPALAHGSEGGFVLLLPTRFYLAGAALAVAASFLLLALTPPRWIAWLTGLRLRLFSVPCVRPEIPSVVAFAFLVFLVVAGVVGSRDPLANPLPLFIWTLWWVGFTLLQAVVGSLWPMFNPWSGPLALLRRVTHPTLGQGGLLKLPDRAGYSIAIVLFFAFAWFELIDLAPNDPFRLGVAVSVYWVLTFVGMIVFGEDAWARRAEPFGIFFGLIGAISPVSREAGEKPRRVVINLTWPGRALLDRPALPLSGILFVLLVLASVSFDGLSRTFTWLAFNGINPLEFPGRSVVVVSGTVGLLAAFGLLTAAFLAAVAVGCLIIDRRSQFLLGAGRFVYSIVPISLAFHAAHYLTALLVDGQYIPIIASDPFGLGMNLFGTADDHITMSFMNTFDGVALIWNSQTVAITLGHIVGIILAHTLALRLFADSRAATLSQLFLAALMVFYTAFGLWLLSTPRI